MDQGKKSNALLEDLYRQKLAKLAEQKTLSDRMNEILCRKGGMNDCSNMKKRNLLAAIAVSNQAGYFEYYKTPREVKEVEDQKILNTLARSIQKVHGEIVRISEEIQQIEASVPKKTVMEVPLSSLNQWFDVYGHPKATEVKDMLTSFSANPKIYGGTNHHKSFKTLSSLMKSGHLTR